MVKQKLTTTNDARFSYDEKTGAVRSFFGAELVGPPERRESFDRNIKRSFDAVAEGREFLETNKEAFKLENISLEPQNAVEGRAAESVTFEQFHQDVPVYGAVIVLGLRALDGHILSGTNQIDYEIPAGMEREEVRLNKNDAADMVLQILEPKVGRVVVNRETPRLFLYRHCTNPPDTQRPIAEEFLKQARLYATAVEDKLYWVWQVMADTWEPNGNWEILLDAVRAEIVAVFDRRRYATRQGLIFKPDPITSSGSNQLSWSTAEAILNNEQVEVTLEDLDEPNPAGEFRLNGAWVKSVDLEPLNFPPPQSAGDFKFGAKDRNFLFTMTYYWTSELIKYLRGFGIPEINTQTLTPFEIDAVGQGGSGSSDNSHFVVTSSGKVYISFGEGGVPDASDAHVIVHEYGHVIHHFLKKRQYCYEEGFADFLAVVWLDRFNTRGFQREKVFPWDGNQSTLTADRAVNRSERFDDSDFAKHPLHVVGDILATALWTLYTSIGGNDPDLGIRKKAADMVILLYLKMLKRVPPYVKDNKVLGINLLAADQDLHGIQGKFRQQIWDAFKKRGLWYGDPPPPAPPD